jgi:hypothetical protein
LVKKSLKNRILDLILIFKDNIQNIFIGTLLVGILLGGAYYIMLSPQSIYSANIDDFPYEKKAVVQKITTTERILYTRMGNQVETASWNVYWKDDHEYLDSSIIYKTHISLREIIFLRNLKPKDTIRVKYKENKQSLIILESEYYNNTHTHK